MESSGSYRQGSRECTHTIYMRLSRSHFSVLRLPSPPAFYQACESFKGRELHSPGHLVGQPSSGSSTRQTLANIGLNRRLSFAGALVFTRGCLAPTLAPAVPARLWAALSTFGLFPTCPE